jgi:hypothetical protein
VTSAGEIGSLVVAVQDPGRDVVFGAAMAASDRTREWIVCKGLFSGDCQYWELR